MRVAYRTKVIIGWDLAAILLSLAAAYIMEPAASEALGGAAGWLLYGAASAAIGFWSVTRHRLHRRIWQYTGIAELKCILQTALLAALIPFVAAWVLQGQAQTLLMLHHFIGIAALMAGPRIAWRAFCDKYSVKKQPITRRALIIGAGSCGTLIAKEMQQNDGVNVTPVGFIDDDPYKHRMQVLGLPVFGGRGDIGCIVENHRIDEIVIAMPSVSKTQISALVNICKTTKVKLRIVPDLQDMIDGRGASGRVRDVSVEDLLGRDPIRTDLEHIAGYVEQKVVLVTGAGGSIGSELCRQIAPFAPSKLLLLGHGENSIYNIEMEMRSVFPDLPIETVIADVQDRTRIDAVFAKYRPQVVFHAAAHKHVPLMERNPAEAIKNNVFGTKNVSECADAYGAERFVLISTDKAVNPTSVMGTTKRIAEMFIQSLDKHSATKFVAVRFGNVLGSRGSVIPRFKDQILKGGPVTVTHPEMVRYFMTIPEAVQLVIQAGSFAKGGEVFILDMGKPVKIYDLAVDLIRLSGYEPNLDIDIAFTGMREGEKLYEELLTNEEGLSSTMHNRIFIGRPAQLNRTELDFEIRKMEKVLGQHPDEIRAVLQHLVPSYRNVGTTAVG
ncbi:polysaccharide biosynthesis protein [Paenibacillus radicis (ex Gao et al. 2016)]|uniref:Polysaccharide biosynthesis protein n=1 Tax=Paenibacillus radicis (ex Gao et al. 2016) TaxID=1737354 RepID=A0A917H3T0_9BACL|nr:nucleoside-diphosphate sugar epimerase/dehydratase [Paenibacillus radicis (ex Gao et al. 2016)]GGG66540.1 polysaccharide biosynthesis protein [Paenibacillus radicis (ex Gao et al. 2016)]